MPTEFARYLSDYSYFALFILIFLQEIGIPVPLPNELLMLFAGYLILKGILLFPLVLLVVISADFIGTMILYIVFYFSGKYILAHKPRWLPLSTATINKIGEKITKGGLWAVFLCRVTPFIRGYTSLISGFIHLKPKLFVPIALLSSVVVCSGYITLGYILGPYWNKVATESVYIRYCILLLVLGIIAIYTIVRTKAYYKQKRWVAEKSQYNTDSIIRLHMVSETAYVTQGQGVHTAYIELLELLTGQKNIAIKVNGEGTGNIFHSHTYGPYYFWKGRPYKGRRILTAHVIPDSSKGTIPFWKQLLPLTTFYLKLAYSYADVVIAISPTVEKKIRDLGIKSKIVRIYNPVLLNNWARTDSNRKKGREKLGIKNDEKLVLGVGQLQERKGVEDFIDMAIAMPDVKFVWVGGRPWGVFTEGVDRINKRIENTPGNIFFTGLLDVKDMPPMYAAADIFLFPSYQENCPLAPLEAAAAGLPVVFRNLHEYKSLYNHPYLNADDTAGFIQITKELLSNLSYYHEAVKLSEELILDFDKEKIKNDLVGLYKTVLDNYFKSNDVENI